MSETTAWKVGPADLRRMAEAAVEPERQRKLLRLAEEFEARATELKIPAKGRAGRSGVDRADN